MTWQEMVRQRVALALDVDTWVQALEIVEATTDVVDTYKVGSQLFAAHGNEALEQLDAMGKRVFLDLKYHDIPNTVASAVANVTSRFPCIELLTVHALGGRQMIERAVNARAHEHVKIIAVTALTSMSGTDLSALGVDDEIGVASWARRLGALALDAGAHGLVCSAHEVNTLIDAFGPQATLITPGIRMGALKGGDDQVRIAEPGWAVAQGSDLLVIGRLVTRADDPMAALERVGLDIVDGMQREWT